MTDADIEQEQASGLGSEVKRPSLIDEALATESHWLRQAKFELLRRDPVDAYHDAQQLAEFAKRLADSTLHFAKSQLKGCDR